MENYVIFTRTNVVDLAKFIAELQKQGVKFHIENQGFNIYVHILSHQHMVSRANPGRRE